MHVTWPRKPGRGLVLAAVEEQAASVVDVEAEEPGVIRAKRGDAAGSVQPGQNRPPPNPRPPVDCCECE